MKKLLIFIAMAIFCQTGFAKSAEEVINEIKKETGAMVIPIDGNMIQEYIKKGDTDNIGEILKNIKSGKIVVLEDAEKKKVDVFSKKTAELDANVYKPIATVFSGNDKVKVLGHTESDTVKEILIIVTEEGQCVMIHFEGNIPTEEIGRLINEKTIQID